MAIKLPMDDGEAFITKVEKALVDCDADFIEANLHRLEELIGQLQSRIHELTHLQYRARLVRDKHERPAEKRGAKQ